MKVTRLFAVVLQLLFCIAICNAQIPDSIASACDIDPYSFVGEIQQESDYGVDECLFWFNFDTCEPSTIMDSIPADQSQSGMVATMSSNMFKNTCISHEDGLATWLFGSLFESNSNNIGSDRGVVFDAVWDRSFTITSFSVDWLVHKGVHSNQPEKIFFAHTDRAGKVIEKDSIIVFPSQHGEWQRSIITFKSGWSSKHTKIVMLPIGNTNPDKPSALKIDNAKVFGDFGCKEPILYKGWDTPIVQVHSEYTDYIYHLYGEDCNWEFHYAEYVLRVEHPELSIQCPEDVTIQCGSVLEFYPYGLATVQSTCDDAIIDIQIQEVHNDCDILTGVVKRFSTTDNYENSADCRQQIHILSPQIWDDSEISWPADVTISECYSADMKYPAQAGWPYADRICGHYGFAVDTLSVDRQACQTIIKRRFTAFDCCNPLWKAFDYTQTITFVDDTAPEFVISPRDTILYTDRCDGIDISGGIIGAILVDDCHSIAFGHQIDDGPIQSGWNPKWFDIGKTKVILIATDQCGNKSTDSFVVSVIDRAKPDINCFDHKIDLASPSGVAWWAKDQIFTNESEDGCGSVDSLRYSFSMDITDNFRLYTCDHLGQNIITLYGWDDDLNHSTCQVTLTITDSKNFCSPMGSRISGKIHNHDLSQMMEDVIVEMRSGSSLCLDGHYEMRLTDADHTIQAYKDTDYLDGVSTLDLIRIQRHILGIQTLDRWQLIAADINNDGRVNGIDLVELRKLILGLYETLPNSPSCRCFELNTDAEEVHIYDTNKDYIVDWRCIKIGDVNLSGASLDDNDPVVLNLYREIDSIQVAIDIDGQSQNTGENDSLASKNHQDTPTATVETNQNETTDQDILRVYPNPVTHTLNIQLDGVFLYEVRDSQQRILIQGVSEDSASIDVSSLTSSNYFLRLLRANDIITRSFIKI